MTVAREGSLGGARVFADGPRRSALGCGHANDNISQRVCEKLNLGLFFYAFQRLCALGSDLRSEISDVQSADRAHEIPGTRMSRLRSVMGREPYPTDLTNGQWSLIEPHLPEAKPGGRPRAVDLRESLNGIFSLVKGGIPGRDKPHDLPPRAPSLSSTARGGSTAPGDGSRSGRGPGSGIRTTGTRARVRPSSTPRASRRPRAAKGCAQAGPPEVFRKFADTPGMIEITANGVVVHRNKRAHHPLLQGGRSDTTDTGRTLVGRSTRSPRESVTDGPGPRLIVRARQYARTRMSVAQVECQLGKVTHPRKSAFISTHDGIKPLCPSSKP
jgi:hypothetical protein